MATEPFVQSLGEALRHGEAVFRVVADHPVAAVCQTSRFLSVGSCVTAGDEDHRLKTVVPGVVQVIILSVLSSIGLAFQGAPKRVATLGRGGVGHATAMDDLNLGPLPRFGPLQPPLGQQALQLPCLGVVDAAAQRRESVLHSWWPRRSCYRPGLATSAGPPPRPVPALLGVPDGGASVMIDPFGAVGGPPPSARDWMVVENVRSAGFFSWRSRAHG